MSKIFVGIDASLNNTGVVLLNEAGEIVDKKLIKTKPDKFDSYECRILYILDQLSFLKDLDIHTANIEGISYSSKGQSTFELAGLNFFIRMYLYQNGIKFEVTPPTSVKKFLTGTGNCKKNLMLLHAYKNYGLEFSDDNICDAWSLSMIIYKKYIK